VGELAGGEGKGVGKHERGEGYIFVDFGGSGMAGVGATTGAGTLARWSSAPMTVWQGGRARPGWEASVGGGKLAGGLIWVEGGRRGEFDVEGLAGGNGSRGSSGACEGRGSGGLL
jgi:hypothetical protein